MDVRGRVALVTGGARGIGRAITEELLAQGAHVAIADRDVQTAERTASQLSGGDTRVIALPLDVRERGQWDAVVGEVEEALGPVAVLVNNAGIMPIGPYLEQGEDVDRLQIEINLFGVMHGMRAVLPGMRRRDAGHVVNISSVAGRIGTPWIATYSAAKHAVAGLTESVAYELKDTGVGFTTVYPALVDTELISGTGRPRFPPPATPRDVAVAVHRAIARGQEEVFVPRTGKLSVLLPALVGRRLSRKIGEALNLGDMFRETTEDRAAYTSRILS